jgi:hypothetical protein
VDRFVGHEAEADRSGPVKSWLSIQLLTYAMDMRKDDIMAALKGNALMVAPGKGRGA